MKTVFISGPMTNIPGYNFFKFDCVAQQLREAGFTVYNPADCARKYLGDLVKEISVRKISMSEFDFAGMIAEELKILAECDYIYLLKGWEHSAGSKKEVSYAIEHNVEFLLE